MGVILVYEHSGECLKCNMTNIFFGYKSICQTGYSWLFL